MTVTTSGRKDCFRLRTRFPPKANLSRTDGNILPGQKSAGGEGNGGKNTAYIIVLRRWVNSRLRTFGDNSQSGPRVLGLAKRGER